MRGKTLYDWLQLLIIPVVLAVAGLLYNRSEKRLEQKLADERAANDRRSANEQRQDATLQAYFDKIEALLLPPHNLRTSQPGDETRDMARVRTLTALRQLNATRRNVLLQFLRDAHLVDKNGEKSIIDFRYANLDGVDLRETHFSRLDFTGVHLSGAQLGGADLFGARLQHADLHGARLQRADLHGAQLQHADLHGARLQRADLSGARLQDANLREAQLQRADLSGAQLLGVNLSGAQLQGADLNGPIFGSANLKQAILDKANLTDSDITVEQLWQAASFAGAKLPPEVEQQLRQAAPGDDGKEGAVPRRL